MLPGQDENSETAILEFETQDEALGALTRDQKLFEENIIRGCIRDTVPRYTRAKQLQHHHVTSDDASATSATVQKRIVPGVEHVESA